MMSIIEAVAQIAMYALGWFIIGSGVAFFIASAFFGFPKEISKEEYNDISDGK